MAYTALAKIKKNSSSTTITSAIAANAATIPVADLAKFRDADGTLITRGIVIGYENETDTIAEEITITGASGSSGAGNLTGATRGVNADGTIGAGYAHASGSRIAVMFSTGTYNIIKDNLSALYDVLRYGHISLTVVQGIVPDTKGAPVGQAEISTDKMNYAYATYAHESDVYLEWNVTMPDDWATGDTLSIQVLWTGTGAGSGNVNWYVGGGRVADGAALTGTMYGAEGSAVDAFQGANVFHLSPALTFTTTGAGRLLTLRAYRLHDANDTYAGDVRLIGLKVRYGRTL